MRKLSEIKGEDALDVLANILEPASEILEDKDFIAAIKKQSKLGVAANVLKHHKEAILEILSVLEGVPKDEYKPSVVEVPLLVLNLLNDPDLLTVFHSADPKKSSGSAMESTGETGHE